MKRIGLILILILSSLMIFSFSSCKKSGDKRELALGIYENKYIFDRLSSGGDSKKRTALKDKTFWCSFLFFGLNFILRVFLKILRNYWLYDIMF
jgi:hypothetical protein